MIPLYTKRFVYPMTTKIRSQNVLLLWCILSKQRPH